MELLVMIIASNLLACMGEERVTAQEGNSRKYATNAYKVIKSLNCGTLTELESFLSHKVRSPMWTIGFVYQTKNKIPECARVMSYCAPKWIRNDS